MTFRAISNSCPLSSWQRADVWPACGRRCVSGSDPVCLDFWFISFGVDSPPSPSSALRAQPWKPPLVTLPNACLARPLGLL